jgi:hypothetical protein
MDIRLARSARGALAAALLGVSTVGPPPAQAGTAPAPVINVTVTGNTALAQIEVFLPVPLVSFVLDFGIQLEQPVNLTRDCLGITATVVDLVDVIPRLPPIDAANVTVSAALPVMVQVIAPSPCGLAFEDGANVDIYTTELTAPLDDAELAKFRLYKAPAGGQFLDITNAVERGSVRTRGTTGGFSDFLILVELFDNPVANRAKVQSQLDYLAARVANPAISSTARQTLNATLAQARAAFNEDDFAAAIGYAQAFEDQVRDFAGEGIPNRWRSARDLDNAAGDLIGFARALRFNLARLDND